jgi:hypothetical protein
LPPTTTLVKLVSDSRGGVGTHLELDTMREKESVRGVNELTPIVTVNIPDGATKPCGHIGKEVRVWRRYHTYGTSERLQVVSAITKDDQVILVTKTVSMAEVHRSKRMRTNGWRALTNVAWTLHVPCQRIILASSPPHHEIF